jgi:signal transduction histidine kinase
MTTDGAGLDSLAGGGETGALMRSIDWSKTSLGPVASWPRSLKTLVSAMLSSRFAMRIMWGPDYHLLYNDPYIPVLGERKHPQAMGRPAVESYPELWSVVGPMFDTVYGGEAIALNDYQLPLNRHGYLEECYFTLSYSPVRDDDNRISGVLGVVHETTEQVLVTRRLATLRELGAAASRAKTAEDACETAAQAMARNAADVPFALFYLTGSETSARLVASTGLGRGARAAPASIDPTAGADHGWPLDGAARSHGLLRITDLASRFGEEIFAGPYPQPVVSAVVLPLARPGTEKPYGFLVAGVNPRRALDDKYEGFYELACEHVSSAISNALAYEHERRRAEELAELDRQKTAFFGNVSHEFRTPLTLMLGPLADAIASPEHALTGQNLVAAHRNALRLLKLVNTLLEFSRIEAGRVRVHLEPTDVSALTREVASAFDSLAKKAGLALVIDCAPGDELAYVDREMWERVLLNLISNAFKFTFEGSIRVTLATVAGRVELAVADTGIGIPRDELPHLFERFHRVEGARARTHEGSGIGLALVHELAKLHGGTVGVESEPGRGSVFRVNVPLRPAHLPGTTAHGSGGSPVSAFGVAPFLAEASLWVEGPDDDPDPRVETSIVPAETRGARVLVVDDNADMRGYVSRVLGRYFAVEGATDGRAGLAQIEARPPDLVLADVMMPELDGFGLVRAIRSDPRTRALPVILLSARVGEESRVDGLDAGADDYLTKPFSARELVARVRTHIELGRLRARIESERRAAAEAERARIHDLFMQAPAAICVLRGPTHVYELANPPYLELVGGRSVVGKTIAEALPEAAPVVLPILDGVFTSGQPFHGAELRVPLQRRGVVEEAYFNFIYKPVVDAAGQVEGIAVVASEVTEQVRSRHSAERLSQALEATNRDLDQFAYVASHDLKAPLRGISNLSQWIEEGLAGKLDDETQEQMRLLRGRVRRLEALIDGILTYSRAGRTRERIEPIDVGALLSETRDLLAPPARATILVGPMPKLDAERVPLQQVFLNLINNALKHAGRPDPRVDVACQDEGAVVHFTVTDNGPGIAPEYQERIWAIFTTLQARDKVEGTGIGLSVVKKIVESRGGRVAVASEVGKGATFHVYWPKRSL